MKKKKVPVGAWIITAVVFLVAMTGCGSYNNTRGWGDAPIGHRSDQPWQIEQAPDDYPNVATRCSTFVDGKRIWIKTHNKTDYPPVITDDPNCKANPAAWVPVKDQEQTTKTDR